jgi:sulfocyanin
MKRTALSLALLFGFAACGGSEPAEEAAGGDTAAPAEAPAPDAGDAMGMTMPDWFRVDGSNVEMDIVAGQTSAGNYWNFNGAQNGAMTITVPVGAQVTINFQNNDPNMAHSVGISPTFTTPPASVDPTPVFEGAISENPTSMTDGTMPGESETVTFMASEAGEYTMVCYIPGHAVSGMWLRFVVSADGEAGVTGGM